MLIYIGFDHTAKCSGRVTKVCRCEQCEREFAYYVEGEAYGVGRAHYGLGEERAKRKAQQQASDSLTQFLDEYPGEVPCPNCGCYQSVMFPWMARRLHKWMKPAAAVCLFLGLFAAIVTLFVRAAVTREAQLGLVDVVYVAFPFVLFGVAAVTLFLLRRRLRASYDPNRRVPEQERLDLGRASALLLDEPQLPMDVPNGMPVEMILKARRVRN